MRLTTLVENTLRQQDFSGLRTMLKSIAEYFNAYGCILWELAPPENERLFTLAHWFPENQIYAIHNLPLADSVTGAAVLGGTINVLDVNEDPRVNRDTPFLDVFSIKSFCSVPIFLSEDSFNTLNLYREGPAPFGPKEVRQIEEVASLIPGFYRAIRDHVSFNLMTTTNKILHEADVAGQVNFTTKTVMKQVIQRICEQVSTAFRCVETSVFLEDPFSRKGEFEKMGTTWPGDFNKKFYSASQDEGITGWVLEKRKPVKIFDLSYFDSDKDEIQLLFPGIRWKDSLEIVPFMVKHFGYASKEQLQPLSFMATPITIGGDVLGVIRCCTAKEGPYYFADRELKTLNLVATRIAQAWRNWVNLRTIEEENRSWESLVTSVSQLNRLVHEELKQEYPKEERIFDRALKMANENISGADILSIRFLDQEKKELYFASFYGDDWKQGTPEEIERRKSRRFPVNGKEATSAGAQAFQTGGVVLTRDVQSMDNHAEPTFPGIQKCLIVSPIVVGDTVVGTLDIRGASEGAFPEHIDTIAGLIGEQLGLYRHLVSTIVTLKRTEEEQRQIFEDLSHQLKSPVIQSAQRTQLAVDRLKLSKVKNEIHLYPIRGLINRMKRVIMNIDIFPLLARQQVIKIKSVKVFTRMLVIRMIYLARDNEYTIDPERNIKFEVDRDSFWILQDVSVEMDIDLIEQAVNNLLENAGKYSFNDTIVHLFGGLNQDGTFHITVKNQGIAITAEEVEKVIERRWQSRLARSVIGGGSGIGLWIVHHIMKAHRGDLVITPTTEDYWTSIQLTFPTRKNR